MWTFMAIEQWPGATGWTSNVALGETTCGDLGSMVGGYQILGAGDYVEKTFGGLEAHNGLRIEGTFFKIDGWNGKKGQLYIDGSLVWESSVYHGQPGISDCCCGVIGYQNGDLKTSLDITVAHATDSATLRFTTNLDSEGD